MRRRWSDSIGLALPQPWWRRREVSVLVLALLLGASSLSVARARQRTSTEPDLATREAQYEETFEAALAMSDTGDPMFVLQAWGTVLMSATMLDRARSMAEGREIEPGADEAMSERVLSRWQALRPDAGGPQLFRTFQIQDQVQKSDAIVALLGRYPDDPLVVWQATNTLRQSGEVARASDAVETFLARNPEHPMGYRMLAQTVGANQTQLAEVLQRWARAAPGDPAMVERWMASSMPEQEPESTRRVLADLFETPPSGNTGLSSCLAALKKGGPEFTEPARACVARIAGDPDEPSQVSTRATSSMAAIAATDGDWSALLNALDSLDPAAAVRALITAARGLETPERCGEVIELLSAATEVVVDGDNGYQAVASALRSCSELPDAQMLYMALLETAPADEVAQVIGGWVFKVNGVYRGQLPTGTADALERRLQNQPAAEGLFKALDVVYRLGDPDDRHYDLLRLWYQRAPLSFRSDQAVDLAWELFERGDPAAAVELLEGQLEARFEFVVAETLWELYLEAAGEEQAELFAEGLVGASDRWRVRAGHTLAARSALIREDIGAAERHYWDALEGENPRRDVAVELLATAAWEGDSTAMEGMARRLCEETSLVKEAAKVPQCAAELLTEVGGDQSAAVFLATQSADLPEDLESLRKLASTAQSGGHAEVAERALRRILELDPRSENAWVGFGLFLEKEGRVEELEELLDDSRDSFSPPPSYLYRATGRALTAAHQPRKAIAVLLDARRALPDSKGGEWSRSWIDHELGQAYRVLGPQARASAPPAGPAPLPAFGGSEPNTAGTASELRFRADDFQSGEGGRYDPRAASDLYARAATMGDPLAMFRLALVQRLAPSGVLAGAPAAEDLFASSVDTVEVLALEGDSYAQYLMGTAALIGLGVEVDFLSARRWLEPAAEQGQSWAWHNLGWMNETGRGLDAVDTVAGLDSYRRAAEVGNTQSMVAAARILLDPYVTGPACEEGLQWLGHGARAGNAVAAAFLGKVLLYGRGECVGRDAVGSLEWLEAGAETHQRGATYDLGMALILAGESEASTLRGLRLLEQVASQPDALAVETLAFLAATGVVGTRDVEVARDLMAEGARLGSDGFSRLGNEGRISDAYEELLVEGVRRLEALTERGDATATALLARLLSIGLGGEVDLERSAVLAHRAADAGEAMAMRVLSGAYRRGEGVERDTDQALLWQQRCAGAGDSFCMMFFGNELLKGEELERDLENGLLWLRRSAEAGNWWAIADLGRLYDQAPYGIGRDADEAAAWKILLADLGDAEAAGWLLYHEYR